MSARTDPPRHADALLATLLPPGDVGLSIIADLHQEFEDVRARRGGALAGIWYWREALALAARYGWVEWRSVERGVEPMATLWTDLKFGVRMLLKTPGLSLVAVLTLALGVGMTTQTYSGLDGTILRGIPVPDRDRFLSVSERVDRLGISEDDTPFHDYLDLKERQSVFEELGAYYWTNLNLSGDEGPPERVSGAGVSANALRVVGVQPMLGRVFEEGDDALEAPRRIVLSYDLWKNRFGARPDVVGGTVRVNGESMEVIGVMPEGFHFPFDQVAWVPWHWDPATIARRDYDVEVFGRSRPGVTEEQVDADLARVSREIESVYPESNEGVRLWARPFTERYMPPQISAVMFLMLAVTFGVLLIACANVANLLMARASARGKEVAIRTALGASRFRVIRQLLAEALVLALLGGVLGVAVAYWGVEAFKESIVGIQKPYWIDPRMDLPTLAFAFGVTLLASLVAGTLPALRASGLGVGDALRDEARGSSSRSLGRFTSALVIGEIAVSCGLLITSGLMIRSIVNVNNADLGFDPGPVLSGRVVLQAADYPTREARQAFFRSLEEKLAAEPGVVSVALGHSLPALGASRWAVRVDGDTYATDGDVPTVNGGVATQGFFETMGIPVLQGRTFEPGEIWDAADPVAVVNQTFVRKYLAGRAPLGERIRLGRASTDTPWARIVGVVGDVHVGGGVGGIGDDKQRGEFVYLTPATMDLSGVAVAVKTSGDPGAMASRLRAVVAEIDPNLPVFELAPMRTAISQATWAFGLFGSLFTIFGLAALFMASVGLYGVMAFSVAQRRQEIGVRMALGAEPPRVLRMVLREGMMQLAVGTVLGLALGYLLSKPLSYVTYGVSLADPFLYLFILGTLGTAGLLACLLPARSATRADPLEAMRPQ